MMYETNLDALKKTIVAETCCTDNMDRSSLNRNHTKKQVANYDRMNYQLLGKSRAGYALHVSFMVLLDRQDEREVREKLWPNAEKLCEMKQLFQLHYRAKMQNIHIKSITRLCSSFILLSASSSTLLLQ